MQRVFISHSKKDTVYFQTLANELERLGFEISNRDLIIDTPKEFKETLSFKVKISDAVIILFSRNSINSNNFNFEYGYISKLVSSQNYLIILPVIIDDLNISELPENIKDTQVLAARGLDIQEVAKRLSDSINRLTGAKQVVQEEKEEINKRMKFSSTSYISLSIDELKKRESKYRKYAYIFYLLGFIALLVCIYIPIWKLQNISANEYSLLPLIQVSILLFFLITILIAVAKYSYSLAKSFMVESLRNSDRIHAIRFGEFYLNAFGEKAKWEEVKEAFQHWNIDYGSEFKLQNINNIDPSILDKIKDILKLVHK